MNVAVISDIIFLKSVKYLAPFSTLYIGGSIMKMVCNFNQLCQLRKKKPNCHVCGLIKMYLCKSSV